MYEAIDDHYLHNVIMLVSAHKQKAHGQHQVWLIGAANKKAVFATLMYLTKRF